MDVGADGGANVGEKKEGVAAGGVPGRRQTIAHRRRRGLVPT